MICHNAYIQYLFFGVCDGCRWRDPSLREHPERRIWMAAS